MSVLKEYVEVFEIKTGVRMAHTVSGQPMGSTLFDSESEARKWIKDKDLTATHDVGAVLSGFPRPWIKTK